MLRINNLQYLGIVVIVYFKYCDFIQFFFWPVGGVTAADFHGVTSFSLITQTSWGITDDFLTVFITDLFIVIRTLSRRSIIPGVTDVRPCVWECSLCGEWLLLQGRCLKIPLRMLLCAVWLQILCRLFLFRLSQISEGLNPRRSVFFPAPLLALNEARVISPLQKKGLKRITVHESCGATFIFTQKEVLIEADLPGAPSPAYYFYSPDRSGPCCWCENVLSQLNVFHSCSAEF